MYHYVKKHMTAFEKTTEYSTRALFLSDFLWILILSAIIMPELADPRRILGARVYTNAKFVN